MGGGAVIEYSFVELKVYFCMNNAPFCKSSHIIIIHVLINVIL